MEWSPKPVNWVIRSEFDIPLVLFDRVLSIIPCDKVSINDAFQAEQATTELLVSECKKIVYMSGIPIRV